MDRHIAALAFEEDADLRLCLSHGVAYQTDQTDLCAYDAAYYDRCASYEGQDIAEAINSGRVRFVGEHFGSGPVVDVGIGSGDFIRHRPSTWGHDVNPVAIEWLKRNDLWTGSLRRFDAATFWDVLEHVPTPEHYLGQLAIGAMVFASIPVFDDLRRVRESRHYRPGEHLYYFTPWGFVAWMDRHGFKHVATDAYETRAGRDSILSFAFRRYRSEP